MKCDLHLQKKSNWVDHISVDPHEFAFSLFNLSAEGRDQGQRRPCGRVDNLRWIVNSRSMLSGASKSPFFRISNEITSKWSIRYLARRRKESIDWQGRWFSQNLTGSTNAGHGD